MQKNEFTLLSTDRNLRTGRTAKVEGSGMTLLVSLFEGDVLVSGQAFTSNTFGTGPERAAAMAARWVR
jgi:hypothetical protein